MTWVRWTAALVVFAAMGCVTPRGAQSVPLRADHVEPELVSVRHTVAPGQTLYRIALAYEISVEELMAANGIDDPRSLAVGQELFIPGAEAPRVVGSGTATADGAARSAAGGQGSDGRDPARKTSAAEKGSTKSAPVSRVPPVEVESVHKGSLRWPLKGVLYGRFGKKGREPHDGIDLAAPLGTPVKTAAPGLVLYAGEQRGYGNIVIVEHASGLVTLYAHNRDLRVKTGQTVRESQVIATVGESGRTSGPHLHFEVRKEGIAVDPLPYLGRIPGS